MRIPARHKHGPLHRGQTSSGAATRPSTHVKRSSASRQPDTARSSTSSSQFNRAVPQRPDGLHAMWGRPGAMSAKQTGQAIILQYSYVAGFFGVISILSGAVLEGDRGAAKTFLGFTIGVYFIIRGITAVCMTLVGCVLRGYWALSDFEGSSKIKSYVVVLMVDWVIGLLVIVAAGVCMHDSFFWWVGIINSAVFQLGMLRTISDLIAMAGRHKRAKQTKEPGDRADDDLDGGDHATKIDIDDATSRDAADTEKMVGGKTMALVTMAAEVSPSAPPIDPSLITTVVADDIEGVPTAPSSPVRMFETPSVRSGSQVLSQRNFEEKWLRLSQLSSSTARVARFQRWRM